MDAIVGVPRSLDPHAANMVRVVETVVLLYAQEPASTRFPQATRSVLAHARKLGIGEDVAALPLRLLHWHFKTLRTATADHDVGPEE